jgi:hypothetical protein
MRPWFIALSLTVMPLSAVAADAKISYRTMLGDGCQYRGCVGQIVGYPAPVVLLVPARPRLLRIHFHGFSERLSAQGSPQGPLNPAYDWNNTAYPTPEAAIRAFELNAPDSPMKIAHSYRMASSVCGQRELVVVPTSRGRCDTYKKIFTSPESLVEFVVKVRDSLKTPATPVHLSAHSGAGKVLRSMLAHETGELTISRVSAFDAFYHSQDAQGPLAWARRMPSRSLRSVVLSRGAPSHHAQRQLGFTTGRGLGNGSRLESLQLDEERGHDHWSLVRSHWTGDQKKPRRSEAF